MSKRRESKKTAVFELEPDGFSIHTFELSKKLTKHEFHHIKSSLYQSQDGSIYEDDKYKGLFHCKKYCKCGVRIDLEHNQSEESFDTYFVRMVVNPRVLIEPGCSYLGILPPEESSIKKLRKNFKKLFEKTVFDYDIKNYYLSRVDLCTNIRCDSNKPFRELVRVLRKLPTPPKYERNFYKHSNKKKANRYNKHYLRFCCCGRTGYLRSRERAGSPRISWETMGFRLEIPGFRQEKFKYEKQFSFFLTLKTGPFSAERKDKMEVTNSGNFKPKSEKTGCYRAKNHKIDFLRHG